MRGCLKAFLSPFDEDEIEKVMRAKPKNKKSSGIDDVSSFIVKACIPAIARPLTYLVNLSFEQGTFPASLKPTTIVPIYKKGSKGNMENYRPVALAPIFSNIFDYCFLERLWNFSK